MVLGNSDQFPETDWDFHQILIEINSQKLIEIFINSDGFSEMDEFL